MPIIDATGHVVGRMASVLAKRLLNGEEIVVVNAEHAIVTGKKHMVFQEYRAAHAKGSTASRMRGIGPAYPRRPDMILRRSISRMMPYQQPRGRTAPATVANRPMTSLKRTAPGRRQRPRRADPARRRNGNEDRRSARTGSRRTRAPI